MKLLLATSFALAAACATAGTTQTAAGNSADCGNMYAARAVPGTPVFAGPDGNSGNIATLPGNTQLCVSNEKSGYNFRRVKLADGRVGYVDEGNLM